MKNNFFKQVARVLLVGGLTSGGVAGVAALSIRYETHPIEIKDDVTPLIGMHDAICAKWDGTKVFLSNKDIRYNIFDREAVRGSLIYGKDLAGTICVLK